MRVKSLFLFLTLTALASACKPAETGDEKAESLARAETGGAKQARSATGASPALVLGQAAEQALKPDKSPSKSLYGYYVGQFIAEKMNDQKSPTYQNKINISIDSVKNTQLIGHSVVAGNLRPFSGTISKTKNGFSASVKEPGDNQYDGVFSFVVSADGERLKGTWTANDKSLAVSSRSYDLEKKGFRYDPKLSLDLNTNTQLFSSQTEMNDSSHKAEAITPDAGKINASVTLLSAKDVENMYKRDLEVMRNAIYARHGYSFQNRQMRYLFDQFVDWYIPVSIDVTKDLTDLEQKNIQLIKRYENHAVAYYDRFGR